MIQDIFPFRLDHAMPARQPAPQDVLFCFRGNTVLLQRDAAGPTLLTTETARQAAPGISEHVYPLFSLGERAFFLVDLPVTAPVSEKECAFFPTEVLREMRPAWAALAGATALHVHNWRACNRFCGICAAPMRPAAHERTLVCTGCEHIVYPRISPAVIVGIVDGKRILLTRYARGPYTKYALVAGFLEVGESFEQAVHREVMEEVGLRVRDLRYFASQPWAFSESVLTGYFAHLDGSDRINLDTRELTEARWFDRARAPLEAFPASLTYEMIKFFKNASAFEAFRHSSTFL